MRGKMTHPPVTSAAHEAFISCNEGFLRPLWETHALARRPRPSRWLSGFGLPEATLRLLLFKPLLKLTGNLDFLSLCFLFEECLIPPNDSVILNTRSSQPTRKAWRPTFTNMTKFSWDRQVDSTKQAPGGSSPPCVALLQWKPIRARDSWDAPFLALVSLSSVLPATNSNNRLLPRFLLLLSRFLLRSQTCGLLL